LPCGTDPRKTIPSKRAGKDGAGDHGDGDGLIVGGHHPNFYLESKSKIPKSVSFILLQLEIVLTRAVTPLIKSGKSTRTSKLT
jgi:hypothetical protein